MRYIDVGEVHKDFHLATNETISFVLSEYGKEFLSELFRRTAHNVYSDIYQNLKNGNSQALLEHWEYYYTREKGDFTVTEYEDGFCFYVAECPAVRHLKENSINVNADFYLQISMLNDAWSLETPFTIDTQIISEGEYKMTVRRGSDDSK